jgi:predicted nucleotidyltransferase
MGSNHPKFPEPIGPALFDATRRAVLRLLFTHADERFYQRQIIRAVGLGSGAVQRDLAQLTRAGILKRTVEGRQTYYQANRTCHVFEELYGLIRKTFGAPEVLQEALHPLADRIQFAFIFGSVASGRGNPESDIDLMIVGDAVSMHDVVSALAGAQDELRREINPSIYAVDEHRSSREEITGLFAVVDRDLEACQTPHLVAGWRFNIAYNAALQLATAALAAAGYQAQRTGYHLRVIQSLTIQLDQTTIRKFDTFRKKRNVSDYERANLVSEVEAEEMRQFAGRLRQDVPAWIRKNHPDFAP